MSTVAELVPGDVVDNGLASATFIARTQHPLWPHLALVVWRMADGSWSHDALDLRQDVGVARSVNSVNRREQLRSALLGGAR